jgi:hypothetical protein
MPPSLALTAWLAVGAALLLGGGLALVRRSGARPAIGRRLAGARQVRVGELLALGPDDQLPHGPVRVIGRVRCVDPIVTREDDRLVALHRDVEVSSPRGAWRGIERLRETRSFELWDHDGSLSIDPADAAEPLVTLPHVWSGSPQELDATYAAALSRVGAEDGAPRLARATTRMISVVDRLLVLAAVRRDGDGRIRLEAPSGGYVLSAMELDDAMRLLGGRRPRLLLAGSASIAVSVALLIVAAIVAVAGLLNG